MLFYAEKEAPGIVLRVLPEDADAESLKVGARIKMLFVYTRAWKRKSGDVTKCMNTREANNKIQALKDLVKIKDYKWTLARLVERNTKACAELCLCPVPVES